MKAAIVLKIIVIFALLVALPLAFAATPKYDKATEVKIKGTVEEVKESGAGAEKDTHLMLKTEKGLMEICLCPAKFLADMDMNFQKGDQLEITGAKAMDKDASGEKEVVLAREIVKGDSTLVLRDKDGGPVWTWLLKK
jgi:hypothetical protein